MSKRIADNKLRAFSIGKTNPIPKKGSLIKRREKEEEKKRLDKVETQHVFDEFVQSFEDVPVVGKTFVRSSNTNPDVSGDPSDQSKIYNPVAQRVKVEAETPVSVDLASKKKRGKVTKKSILESFKEELKRTQKERTDRHSFNNAPPPDCSPSDTQAVHNTATEMEVKNESTDLMFDLLESGDSISTNLYVGNINPKMNEEMLCQVFGKFGALASVKVMWPRTDEEKARDHNCGFVAYMKREQATQALNELKGTKLLDFPVQLGWGKPVPLPHNPVYVHPDLIKIQPAPPQLPDPPSGLPFNAQCQRSPDDLQLFLNEENPDTHDRPNILLDSIIRVTIPTEEDTLRLVHRMIEFVVREGPMFEAMIMTKEINNKEFRFLFDNQSPAHIYYRWKLFSILQGDSPETWRTEDFRLFQNGSIWRPPPLQPIDFSVVSKNIPEIDVVKLGCLSSRERDELEDILRELSMERKSVCPAMVFCIDHSEAGEEVVECVTESLTILETPLHKKTARLYLVSDILNNSTVKIDLASSFRSAFEKRFEEIFRHFSDAYEAITDEVHGEHFKILILKVLFSWERQNIYSSDFLIRLKRLFLPNSNPEKLADDKILEDLDGQPMETFYESQTPDLDGIPMDPELDGEPMLNQFDKEAHEAKFKPIGSFISIEANQTIGKSKWELIDDPLDEILEQVDQQEKVYDRILYPDITAVHSLPGDPPLPSGLTGGNMDENTRRKLRDIELKVAKFADELEGLDDHKGVGKKANRVFIEQKIEGYRKVLLEDFYQSNSSETIADNHPVTMDIHKTSKPTQAAKTSKFFSQYTDSESENLSEEINQKGKKNKSSKSRKSHKSESRHSRDAPIYESRSRSYSPSDSPSSELAYVQEHGHSKKPKRSRHDSASPTEDRSSRRHCIGKDKLSSRARKRHSNSNSPTHHARAKSSKKNRRQSSDSRSPSPHKRPKKPKHH